MARYAIALKAVDYDVAPRQPEAPRVEPVASAAVEQTAERPIWLFRGLFGVNLTLWIGIVATIRYMI